MLALSLIGIPLAGVYADLDMPADRVTGGFAGGAIAASTLDTSCKGYIWSQPDHRVNLDQAGNSVVAAHSDAELALVAVRVQDGEVVCTDFSTDPTLELDDDWYMNRWDVYTATKTPSTHPEYEILAMGHPGGWSWWPDLTTASTDWFYGETVTTTGVGCVANPNGYELTVGSHGRHMLRGIEYGLSDTPFLTLTNTDTGQVLCSSEDDYLGGDDLMISWTVDLAAGTWVVGATKGDAGHTRTTFQPEVIAY